MAGTAASTAAAPPLAEVTSSLRAFSRERAPCGQRCGPPACAPHVHPRPSLRAGPCRARAHSDGWRCSSASGLRRATPARHSGAAATRGSGRAGADGFALKKTAGVGPCRRGRRCSEEDLLRCPGGAGGPSWLSGQVLPSEVRRAGAAGRRPGGGGGGAATGRAPREEGPPNGARARWWGRRGPAPQVMDRRAATCSRPAGPQDSPGVRSDGRLVSREVGSWNPEPTPAPGFLPGIGVQHQGGSSTPCRRGEDAERAPSRGEAS